MATNVAKTEDIPSNERRFYEINGVEIAVLNVDGTYYAIRNSCPHMEGPVGRGPIEVSDGQVVISCPFHEWTFDIETGKALFESKRLLTYDVTVDDDEIVVGI
jgi:nitrite reductase (NADH) small subunit